MWNKLNIKQKHVDSLETQVIQLKAIQPDRTEADQAKDIIVQAFAQEAKVYRGLCGR